MPQRDLNAGRNRSDRSRPMGGDRRQNSYGQDGQDRQDRTHRAKRATETDGNCPKRPYDALKAEQRRAKRKAKAEARKTGVPGEEIPRKHEPVIEVRPFSSVDFSQIVRIMPTEWLFAGMSEAEEEAQAQMDAASSLAASCIALVASVDDGTGYDPVTAGCLLAKNPDLPLVAGTDAWKDAAEDAGKTLRYGSPQARKAHAYVSQLDKRGGLLIEAVGGTAPAKNEVELLCVSAGARGTGVGSALVAAYEQLLRDSGESCYWLQTDTACDWQWYDRHGFERVAEVEVPSEYPMPPGNEEDGTPSSPARLFMYRKTL